MRTLLAFIFAATAFGCFGQQHAIPARRILPGDIEQDSIRMVRFSTNNYAVRWIYTEAGARAMLAFNETHKGQETRIMIGSYVSPATQWTFIPMPPLFTTCAQWKEGWLKHRGDKVVGVTEADAKKIMDGLKRK